MGILHGVDLAYEAKVAGFGWLLCYLIGQAYPNVVSILVTEDDMGFFSFATFDNPMDAQRRFDRYEARCNAVDGEQEE
jgi:hypothetical protein